MGEKIQAGAPAEEVLEEGVRLVFEGVRGTTGWLAGPDGAQAGPGAQGQDGGQESRGPAVELEPFVPTPYLTEVFGDTPQIRTLSDQSFHVSNVDGLFENLMVTDTGIWSMDYEWVFDFPIPVGYLRYRNLYYFYERFKGILGWTDVKSFLQDFGIGEELAAVYQSMEAAFQTYVHGDSSQGYLCRYQQPVTALADLEQADQALLQARERISQLQIEVVIQLHGFCLK